VNSEHNFSDRECPVFRGLTVYYLYNIVVVILKQYFLYTGGKCSGAAGVTFPRDIVVIIVMYYIFFFVCCVYLLRVNEHHANPEQCRANAFTHVKCKLHTFLKGWRATHIIIIQYAHACIPIT